MESRGSGERRGILETLPPTARGREGKTTGEKGDGGFVAPTALFAAASLLHPSANVTSGAFRSLRATTAPTD
jgi:hypothetical protein